MAILGLDGKFKQLNPAFAKLVGYKEHEFTKAAWPSPHDRRDYKDQLEQLRQIGLGDLRDGRRPEHLHARPGPDGPGCRQADRSRRARTASRCTCCSRPKTVTRGSAVGAGR